MGDKDANILIMLIAIAMIVLSVVIYTHYRTKKPFVWPSKEERQQARRAQTPKQRVIGYSIIVIALVSLIVQYQITGDGNLIKFILIGLPGPILIFTILIITAKRNK
jgi:uncharacterized iron-regulated membrane protein